MAETSQLTSVDLPRFWALVFRSISFRDESRFVNKDDVVNTRRDVPYHLARDARVQCDKMLAQKVAQFIQELPKRSQYNLNFKNGVFWIVPKFA